MDLELDNGTIALLVIIGLPMAVWILVEAVMKYDRFCRELDYINMEIGRTIGAERQHWIKEKRRLWLSLIPFFRK